MTTTLESLRAKIIEAMPEITSRGYLPHKCPITLADVLRAIGKNYSITFAIAVDGEFEWRIFMNNETVIQRTGYVWNLALPLNEQSPEVHEFLNKILTN